ncbi:hypothetical protein HEBU111660_07045 [Helicobacter burdigaliensis]
MILNTHFYRGFRGLNYAPTHYYVRYVTTKKSIRKSSILFLSYSKFFWGKERKLCNE